MTLRRTKLESVILASVKKSITKLAPEDGDFLIVKDAGTWEAIVKTLQTGWKPKADVAFLLAPEGLDKCSREDLEQALKSQNKVILAQ
jgi:hypothetical protein